MEQTINPWKSLNNGFYENIIPVIEKQSGKYCPTGSCQVREEQKKLFEAAE